MTKKDYLRNISEANLAIFSITEARNRAAENLAYTEYLIRKAEPLDDYKGRIEDLIKSPDEQAIFMEKVFKMDGVDYDEVNYFRAIFTRVNKTTNESLEGIQRYLSKVDRDKENLLGYLDTSEAREFVENTYVNELNEIRKLLKEEFEKVSHYPDDTEFE